MSLFSGMGGMDIGFAEQVVVPRDCVTPLYIQDEHTLPGFVNLRRLPFRTVFQNDILPEARKIAQWNHWDHSYVLKDIRELLQENFTFPHADVVTGGFPCQDFSHAGKRLGFESTRGTLYQSFVEILRRIQPIVFVAENVQGLLTMHHALQQILADFTAVGYHVRHQLVKCEEYGIPQTRWRVLIFGIRIDRATAYGIVEDTDWHCLTENKLQCSLRPFFAHLLEPDQTNDDAQKVFSKAARLLKGQGQKEVQLDRFAPTMRAEHHGNIEFRRLHGGIHTDEAALPERRLTVREAALIQTFPPDCRLTEQNKPTGKAYKPIGNAVPPLLAYIVARKVLQILTRISTTLE